MRRSQSAELLSRVESDGEVPLGAYDSWVLAAAGAGSPLHGLVITDEMREMGDDAFLARLAQAREELGYLAPPEANGHHSRSHSHEDRDGDADSRTEVTAEEVVTEFELPHPLNFIVAARRTPAFIGLAYVTDRADISPEPQLHVGWRGVARVLHGVLGEDGQVGVLEERRDPQGVHQFVLRSPAIEATALYDGFVARPTPSEDDLLSLHVFHPDEMQPRHLEVRLTSEPDGASESRFSTDDGTAWAEVRSGAEAGAGWVVFVSAALAIGP